MWEGEVTEELKEAFKEYARLHDGMWPDGYDDLEYSNITYEHFLELILEANRTGKDIVDVFDEMAPNW